MKKRLTNTAVSSLKPESRLYKVWDTEMAGFFLRVSPKDKKTFCIHYRYNGAGRDYTLGVYGNITPTEARNLAKSAFGDIAQGIDIQSRKKSRVQAQRQSKFETLGGFIEHRYSDWVKTERKSGNETLELIERDFEYLYPRRMDEISTFELTKWRTEKLKGKHGRPLKKTTVNRRLAALKAVLSKAVEWGLLESNPLARLKPLKLEDDKRVRFLSDDEELRLRNALRSRHEQTRVDRQSANQWRKARNYAELPALNNLNFVDYLEPIILLAMNTGMRRGEIFQLNWQEVSFADRQLTVRASTAKDSKTRHIPLNDEALGTLIKWSNQREGSDLVFPSPVTGVVLNNIKKAWSQLILRSAIQDLRFHDLRHHFASKLAMAGVDLNTVRELMGHASLNMTLRYAHLAPEHKAAAVAVLNRI